MLCVAVAIACVSRSTPVDLSGEEEDLYCRPRGQDHGRRWRQCDLCTFQIILME